MTDETSSLIVAALATIFALIGLFLWAGALDTGIAVFGCSLALFGVAFDFWLIKAWFDRREAASAAEQRP